ncbi:hypothetical protein ACG0Z5_01565 [Scandinavium sp. M-37]|uniref:hypothetical protein n=1 Tax=Scandinavium sp. M-37 TaxID=3373077 RepID=UPI00374603C9
MKKLSRTTITAHVLGACMLVFMGNCQADDSCQITLSQPLLDLHMLNKSEAIKSAQGWNQMQDVDVNVSVFCPTERTIAVFFAGSAGDKGRFKFGQQSGLSLKVSQLSLDGKQYAVTKIVHPGSLTNFDSVADIQPIYNHQGIIATSGNRAVEGQQMNFTLTVTPYVKESEFKASDRQTLSSDLALAVMDN